LFIVYALTFYHTIASRPFAYYDEIDTGFPFVYKYYHSIMTTPEKIKSLKLKLTPQRLAVVQFLEGNEDHPSALDTYQSVSKRFPGISLATIYNILETLRAKGILQEISIDRERKRFDPNPATHHHLICTTCKAVKDIHKDIEPTLLPQECHNFHLTGIHVDFYGICPDCQLQAVSVPDKTTHNRGR
jgi:Fur family transcriptional regulator, peroxide stress response regulator